MGAALAAFTRLMIFRFAPFGTAVITSRSLPRITAPASSWRVFISRMPNKENTSQRQNDMVMFVTTASAKSLLELMPAF